MHAIVNADLARSGRFDTLATGEMPQQPSTLEQMNIPAWRTTGVNYAAVGQVVPQGGGSYVIRFQIVDIPAGSSLPHSRCLPAPMTCAAPRTASAT